MTLQKKLLKPVAEYSWEGNTQESIVLHTTLGNTYIGAEETLKVRHLSYHYVIDKDGAIYQLVDIDRAAWHAGVKSKPNMRASVFYGTDNPNRRSIGIAFVGTWMGEFTNEQRDAAVWLIKEIGKQTGVRYTADNIFYHQEITNYKPAFVSEIRQKVLTGLIGFKDETDAGEKARLQLFIEYLKLKIKLLTLQKNERKEE